MGQVFRPVRLQIAWLLLGLNPRLVGQVFRLKFVVIKDINFRLNPRLVGQVFRHLLDFMFEKAAYVLIPD